MYQSSFVADDGAAPSSFALWREERGVVAAFIFDDAKGLSSFVCGRRDGGTVMAPTIRSLEIFLTAVNIFADGVTRTESSL